MIESGMDVIRKCRRALGCLLVAGAVAAANVICLHEVAAAERAQPAAYPTARPATPMELAAFEHFSPRFGWRIVERAVSVRYALVSFYNAGNSETALLMREPGGAWMLVARGGAQMTPAEMIAHIPAMPIALAQCLYDLAQSQDAH